MVSDLSALAERMQQTRERIGAAAAKAGRRPGSITLVAVSKRQPISVIETAMQAGLTEFGENYVQEALEKQDHIPSASIKWHLIGHLQTNKAKHAVGAFGLIQSVDSIRLGRLLGRHSLEQGLTQDILLQVHLGHEETKSGFTPEMVADAAAEAAQMPGVRLLGLMGIAPQSEDSRPYFRQIRGLFDALPAGSRRILSMGMTGDFETAIEEGATMVRIGSAIFGPRTV